MKQVMQRAPSTQILKTAVGQTVAGNAIARRSIAGVAGLCAAGLLMATTASAASQGGQSLPQLKTNQGYVETVTKKTTLDPDKPMSIFKYVLDSLPEAVTVYPSENYYYFSFTHQGHEYAGNLRLDVSDRDKGLVHFAYFKKYTEWRRGEDPTYKLLGPVEKVGVKKLGKLSYSISHAGKTVRFSLVDVSHVKPPKGTLLKQEQYIGPVFDESGIQFYLVFNTSLKVFHYVLNEAVPVGETLFQSEVSKNISIGLRTGFAYYQDPYLKRKILIGVHQANSRVNNYFDGPFDQLPDNFIEGNVLHDAILAVQPDLKGKIDRFGNSPDGATRFFIGPYMHYEDEFELSTFSTCMADKEVSKADYGLCFVVEQGEEEGPSEGPEKDGPETTEAAKASTPVPAKKP